MMRLIRLARRLVYDKRRYLFYRYDAQQGSGKEDSCITVYDSWKECPAPFRRLALRSRLLNVMYYRLQRGDARLLCYTEDGDKLQAYGWIQDWRPFRRKFGMLASEGTMLGPYWSAPEDRGRGLYGRLLEHSLHLSSKTQPILVYTSPDNTASQKGILRAGFRPIGEWTVCTWLGLFTRRHKHESTAGQAGRT